jgi:hypothetical protein
MYASLPARFGKVAQSMHGWAIIVYHDGMLRFEELEDIEGTKFEGAGRRWSYLPWTKEQHASCQPTKITKIKLRMWNTAMEEGVREVSGSVEG